MRAAGAGAGGLLFALGGLACGGTTSGPTRTQGPGVDVTLTAATAAPTTSAPVETPPAKTVPPAKRIAMGKDGACAVHLDGALSCWGGGFGPTPKRVANVSNAVDVAIGRDLVVVGDDGSMSVFVDRVVSRAPVVVPTPSPVTHVSANAKSTCVLRKDGRVACWMSELVDAKGAPKKAVVVPGLADVRALSTGEERGLVVQGGGKVSTFEIGSWKTLAVPGVDDAVDVASSPHVGCFRRTSGATTCVLAGDKLGVTVDLGVTDAVAVSGDFGDWPMVCGTHDATLSCERPKAFEASYSLPAMDPVKTSLPAGRRAVQIAASKTAACVLDDVGAVRCLGHNIGALLGRPDTRFVEAPAQVPGLPRMKAVAVGDRFSCALDETTALWCWGKLPSATTFDKEPVIAPPRMHVAQTGATRLVAHQDYGCLFSATDEASCFYARRENTFVPERVPAFDRAKAIALPAMGFANAVGAIDASGKLVVGPTTGFDTLKDLVLTPVAQVPRAETLAVVNLGLASGPGSYGFLVTRKPDGKMVSVEVGDFGTRAPRGLVGLDGAIAIQNQGMALFAGGKVKAGGPTGKGKELLASSPLVTLADGARICGSTADGKFGCMGPAGFETIFEAPKQVASSNDHDCAVVGDGEVWCRGANTGGECGVSVGVFKSTTLLDVALE